MNPKLAKILGALGLALLLGCPGGARSEEVWIRHKNFELIGNLEKPVGQALGSEGAVLIVHGTLAHHGMEIIVSLQRTLKMQGIASLGITLSLDVDGRRGMFDCSHPHDYTNLYAGGEINAWVAWLKSQGAGRVTLAGHSRGAGTVVDRAVAGLHPLVDRLVLLAPLSDTHAELVEGYKRTYGGDLDALLTQARALVAKGEAGSLLPAPGFLMCKGARVTAETFLEHYAGDPAQLTLGRLKKIKFPVLVVAAGADSIAPKVVERTRAASPSANVELTVIDGADHFFRDLFMDDLVERLVPFLGHVPERR